MSNVRRPNYNGRVKDMVEQEQQAKQNAADDALNQQAQHSKRSGKQTLASQLLKKAQKANAAKKSKNAQKPQRASRSRHAHGAHAAHDAHEEHMAEMEGMHATVEGIEDEVHRRKHTAEELMAEQLAEEEIEEAAEEREEEKLKDTHATGADSVTRSQADQGESDGFEGRGNQQREAYERWLRGNVRRDKARFDELRSQGRRDDFNPDLKPLEVEALGTNKATAHVVRIYEKWTLEGQPRAQLVTSAAELLAGFAHVVNIRKVLAQLETKPIRDVYPLEVMMKILEQRPELLPGVRPGSIVGNAAELLDGKKVLAGVPVVIPVPSDVRIKAFALLGGGRPGYEFQPHTDEGKYTLLVDTPGHWTFTVLAAPLSALGSIKRETNEAILEVFAVTVHAMGVKGEPVSPEDWAAQQAQLDLDDIDFDDDDDDDDNEDDRPREIEIAPNLAVQIRRALEGIARDLESTNAATTYSWSAVLFKPGAPVDSEPLLKLSVAKAGPFDQAWVKAREAIAAKQKEVEPGRAIVTGEDFTAALRRARVR
jgi:hypothetical protein